MITLLVTLFVLALAVPAEKTHLIRHLLADARPTNLKQ